MGDKRSNQSRTDQSGGGQLQGKAPNAPALNVPNFQGSAGQGNNQNTNRPKGHS